ncbi:MAG TPA: tail fiber domain-containing protein, partial [Nevskia sp.]|nr:tail fiber domain-containing protein [Nevskia sp.]
MSGSDTQQATQSQSVTQLPPWINQAAQQNYAFAQNVANRPMQQYQGQMVADVGPQTQQGWNLAAQGGGAGQDQYNASQAGYLGVMGQQPQQVTPQQLSSTDLQPYMNPYTQSVINTTLPIMQQNLALSQNQQQNAANSANAFGGSRQAIQQGVTQAQGALGMGQMAAQLNQANFGQAQAAATGDISRNLSAQQLNQAAQQNQAGLNVQAAQGLGALGNQAQLSQARNFAELQTAGAQQQQQAQAQINAQMGKFQQAWGYPGTQLGVLQSALGMTPYGQAQQGQSTTQNTFTPDYAAAALTGLQTVGSLFGGGGMFGAGGAFGPTSDRRLKTDIKKVGDHPAGVPLFSYRYKGDPKTYPKVVGPMAEDVMKIAP